MKKRVFALILAALTALGMTAAYGCDKNSGKEPDAADTTLTLPENTNGQQEQTPAPQPEPEPEPTPQPEPEPEDATYEHITGRAVYVSDGEEVNRLYIAGILNYNEIKAISKVLSDLYDPQNGKVNEKDIFNVSLDAQPDEQTESEIKALWYNKFYGKDGATDEGETDGGFECLALSERWVLMKKPRVAADGGDSLLCTYVEELPIPVAYSKRYDYVLFERVTVKPALREYSIDSDFTDDCILIVLTLEETRKFLDYSPDDFAAVGCVRVQDLTVYTIDKVKEYFLEGKKHPTALINYPEFQRILAIYLDKHDKQNVLDMIKIVYDMPGVQSAEPNWFCTAT